MGTNMSRAAPEAPRISGNVQKSALENELPRLDEDRFLPANRRRLSGPSLRTFVSIADLWDLNEEQRRRVLGSPSRSTYQSWTKSARDHREITLDVDVLTRISAVFGIHMALGILEGSNAAAVAWLRDEHQATVFGGRPPMELMTSGIQDDLLTVRRFLDAARGGQSMMPNKIDRDFRTYMPDDIVVT